jgi:hypothetical protein
LLIALFSVILAIPTASVIFVRYGLPTVKNFQPLAGDADW